MLRRLIGGIGALALCFSVPLVALEVGARVLPPISTARFEDRSVVVRDAASQPLRTFLSRDQRWRLHTTTGDLPPEFLPMLLAYEDKRFEKHHGIDFLAAMRAGLQLMKTRRIASGASTISMQVARLLEPKPRSLMGKVWQLIAARQLERRFSKRQLLNMYLTLAPFGGNIEGLRAAASAYFGKAPRQLSIAEMATLIALPQSPRYRRPDRFPVIAQRARARVLDRAVSIGQIDVAVAQRAKREKLTIARRSMIVAAPHLAELLKRRYPQQAAIDALVDRDLQTAAQEVVGRSEFVRRQEVSAAAIVVRNSDMAVRAYVSGSGFFDEIKAGQVDLIRAVRSPGSALKPFVYALGFEKLLIHPLTIVTDAPMRFAAYEPKNFADEFHGDMTVRDALIRSINTAAVSVLAKVGPATLMTRLRGVGTRLQIEETDVQAGLAIALGGCGTTLADLAQLYAALANGGEARALRYIATDPLRIYGRLTTPEAAWAVNDILADNPPPDGFVVRQAADGGRRIAYKTGTSYSFRDAWAVGYDADHTVAVWIGRPDGAPNLGSIGRNAAAPLLYQIMDLLARPEHDVAFDRPTHSDLADKVVPARLQRFGEAKEQKALQPLKILFPQADTAIAAGQAEGGSLPLVATGGTLPLYWFVDGRPIEDSGDVRELRWRPEARGHFNIRVMDSVGQTAGVTVWVD